MKKPTCSERKISIAKMKAYRELEKKLRGGWGEASTLSLARLPNECGKRTKPMPSLDELDQWQR